MSKKVEGRIIKQTYVLEREDVVADPKVPALHFDFPLCEADYLRLTRRDSKLFTATVAVLLLSVSYGISILAKHLCSWCAGTPLSVESWEYVAVAIGLVIASVILVVSWIVPNERRELLKKMKEHFQKHPRQPLIRKRP